MRGYVTWVRHRRAGELLRRCRWHGRRRNGTGHAPCFGDCCHGPPLVQQAEAQGGMANRPPPYGLSSHGKIWRSYREHAASSTCEYHA